MPKTWSGKIMRWVLKAEEFGPLTGDLAILNDE